MDELLQRLLSWMKVDDDTIIEQRLFRVLALLSGLLSILVVIPMNLAQSLPGFINACVLVFGVGSLLLFGATFRGHYNMKLLFFLHMADLDLVWFSNAGTQGSIGLYFFGAALYLVIFFRDRTRWLMLGLFLVNGAALLWAEWLHPEWVRPFVSLESRFLDLITGFILSSLVCVLILWVVLEAYHQERQRLKASLEAQRKSEARFQALVLNAPIPIAVANTQGALEYVNRSFEQVLGYTIKDVPDMDAWWGRAYPDVDLLRSAQAHWSEACAIATATHSTIPPAEYPVVGKDGQTVHLEIQAALVGDQWLVMFTDVSERRRAEEVLRQAQKLESLGVLAGGIAHDFNNLLSAMLGNLDLAQVKSPIGSAAIPYLQNMEGAILKATELTRQMLAYSGKGRFVVEPMDLNRLVAEISPLLVVSVSKKVQLKYELAPALPPIEADLAQVHQVVMNLVTNASEAIGASEGIITLATGLREINAREVEVAFPGQALEPGSYVTLGVSDTGCGMEPQVLARIFDPFFTTKESGRGLGLSALLGILRGHRAGLKIQSEPGQGTLFQILFKASTARLPESGPIEPGAHKDRFHGKVLLVDDEAELRFSFGSMLQHLGFRVVAARDGQEALERFIPGEFTLVFMDLTMPRMDGKEALFQLKARDPEVRVILTSGYSESEAFEPLAGLRPAGFIQKPFSLEGLTRVLEKALE